MTEITRRAALAAIPALALARPALVRAQTVSAPVKVGLLSPVTNLPGLYDLSPLNSLLKADGQPQVSS